MTETDNKTRYGRIVVIFIALAIVIAAFVLFITMNNERISEQNTKYLQGSTEQSARRISEWMNRLADRDQAFVLHVREHAFER